MENDLTGKLSPDGLDSAAKEGNATFKKNYVDEKLAQGTISPETAATYFPDEQLTNQPITVSKESIPQGDITTPIDIPEGVPIVLDKTEPTPIDQVVPPVQEDIPNPINDTKLQTDQLYVNDLARMANTIGVGKKYTPEAIKSNIDNPKFLDELFKQLDGNPRTAGEAGDLRDTKHQRLLNEVSTRLGFVPSTGKMSTPELEKTIGQMDQDINTVKQWTVKQDLTYPEAMKTGEITDGMAKAFAGGPDVAFKYFNDKIKDNPDLNPYYKGLVANSLHEQMIKASTETGLATNDEIFANLTSLSEFDAKTKVVSDFKKNNENGFLAGQALQTDKNETILRKMLPLVDDMYKLATIKLDQTIEEQTKLNPGSPLSGPVFNLNEKITSAHDEKALARNAQIMLKDMERLILQFRNPEFLGHFEPTDPSSMSTLEKIGSFAANKPGEKFVPGKMGLGIEQGVKSPLWNVESLLPLIPIIKKYQDGKDLTDVEQLALNSFSALNTAQGTIPKTFAFEFGESVYTNVQFMATLMAASPLYEGVFKVVEHSVEKGLKAVAQKEIGDMVVSKIAGGLTKSLANVTKGWLPELSGMVVGNLPVVFTQPMFYNEIIRNIVGQGPTIANFDNLNANQTDVFRNLKIDASQALKSNPLRSTWDAFRHTFVEDFTENLGLYGDKGLDLLANKVSGKYGKWFTGGAASSTWRQKARLNGILMENMEEWIGAPLNWILGDDTETLKQQFTPRSLAMIAASVGVFTVPGYAMSKYQVYKGNKAVTELSDQAQVSMGLDKWKAFQDGLKETNTLNSRAGFVQDFIQKNSLSNEQVDMAVKYAGIATSNEIRNGAMTKAGMNAGRGDYQSLADLKLQNKLDKKSELLDLIESNPKTKEAYNALLEEYKGKIVDPNMTPDEVNKNFRQAFKDLLLHPEINAQASEITKKFNKIVQEAGIQTEIQKIEKEYKTRLDALRTPEEVSTDQMVQHEMNLVAQEHRQTIEKRVKEEIQGMTSSQLTERHTPIQTLLGTATSPQLRIEQIDKQLVQENLAPEKIVELNGYKDQLSKMSEEKFNELKYERNYVANVNKIVTKQEQDDHIRSLVKTMSSGFIDQQGHVNTSLNHSSTIQDAFNAEDEFNRQMNAGELTDATRTKLSEAIGEIKRRYWPELNDKKGVQITEVINETVKPGMKVILQSNLLGVGNDRIKIVGEVKDLNKKNGTALIEITASNGEKSEVVFNQKMGNSGLWNLFENQNQEQNQLIGEQGAVNLKKKSTWFSKVDDLQTAKKMNVEGKDKRTIKLSTGWELGGDGKWKYEIADNIKFTDEWNNSVKRQELSLQQAIDAPDLFKIYPELKDIKIKKDSPFFDLWQGTQGWFNPEKNELVITPYAQDPIGTLVHEIQHWIQTKEGFAKGGNTESAIETMSNEELKDIVKNIVEKKKSELSTIVKNTDELSSAFRLFSETDKEVFKQQSVDFLVLKEESDILFRTLKDIEPNKNPYSNPDMRLIEDKEKKVKELVRNRLSEILGKGPDIDLLINVLWESKLPLSGIITKGYNKIKNIQDEIINLTTAPTKEDIVKLVKREGGDYAYNAYRRLAGEVESRNVTKRMNMSQKERQNSILSDTEDVIEEQKIYLMNEMNQSLNMQSFLGQPTKKDSFTHKGKTYISNENKLALYQKERQDLTNRVRYFKTEGLAKEALVEHRKRWGSNVLGRVAETDTHKFVLRMSNPLLGTDEVLADKTKLDRLRVQNQSLIELSQPFNDWRYDNRTDEQKSEDALAFQSVSEMLAEINLNARNLDIEHESKDLGNQVNYVFSAIDKIQKSRSKLDGWWNQIKDKGQFWDKVQKDLGINKQQIELIKGSNGNTIDEILVNFLSNYSQVVKIDIAVTKTNPYTDEFYATDYLEEEYRNMHDYLPEEITMAMYVNTKLKEQTDISPSQHYINLTVSGGTNYTENRIITPQIEPSIKGHPRFAENNDIGWFRSDEQINDSDWTGNWEDGESITNAPSTTRRILEIQSDLFQKGRDNKNLTDSSYSNFENGFNYNGDKYSILHEDEIAGIRIAGKNNKEIPWKEFTDAWENAKNLPGDKENQFLQLLNKEGNWINFFIKSIIQDSAEKGYKTVLFPTGETAAKVEGHETLIDEIEHINNEIDAQKKWVIRLETEPRFMKADSQGTFWGYDAEGNGYQAKSYDEALEYTKSRIDKLEQKKQEFKSQGIEKLKPIEAFYEIRITNILNKIYGSDNVKLVTDEFKNQWREITIDKVRDSNPVVLEQRTLSSDYINTEIERAKVLRVMNVLSHITHVRWNMVEGDPKGEGRRGWTWGDGTYFVNMQTAKLDTPIHEYAHPIMDAIEVEYPALFDTLYKELEQSKDLRLKSIIEDVNRLYGNLTSQQKRKETIVTALGLEGQLRIKLDMSPFAQTIYKIANAIRNWLQETFGIGGLTVNTTLGELSKMIITGRVRIGEAKTNIEHEAKGDIKTYEEKQAEANSRPGIPQNVNAKIPEWKKTKDGKPIKAYTLKTINGLGLSSIEMIINGTRTRTTRSQDEMNRYNLKAGDYVNQFGFDRDGNQHTILTRVTAIYDNKDPRFLEDWSKEGWADSERKNIETGHHTHAIEFKIITKNLTETNQINPSEYTDHSGGAIGADSMWDKIGRTFGFNNHNHYWANSKTPLGNFELTPSQLQEGISHAKDAAKVLGRPWNDQYANLLGRNWFQVKNSTQVLAIAPLIKSGEKNIKGFTSKAIRTTVDGGTGYAVEMAIANSKSVYVFDTKSNQWFQWNGIDFIQTDTPVLDKNYAGIGSRQDGGNMTSESVQAIKDVYEKTLTGETNQVVTQQPVVPSKKIETKSGFVSIDRAMTVTYDEFYTLMESNADMSKYEMIQKAITAGRKVYMTSPMYLGELDNSRRQMQLDIFENMMHKMLKKKKIVTDDEGKSVEMDNFEGPAATSEDKFDQFKSGFSKVISALSKVSGLTKDVIEKNLVDIFNSRARVSNEYEYGVFAGQGFTPTEQVVTKTVYDNLSFTDFLSLQNFYGSVHFEEQYGIELSMVNGEMKAIDYKQSVSATDSSLHSVFDEHIKNMNQYDLVRISKVYDDFRKFNTSRVGNFIINQEFLDKTRNMLMVLTGLNTDIIDVYLSSPRLVGDKLLYYKNEKFVPVPYGSNLTQLLGERLYYRDKLGKEQPFKYIPVLSAFGFEVHNNGDQISKQLIQSLFNKKKGGYSNIDIILMAHAKSNTGIGMSGTDIEGNRFGTMTLAHQLYNQSLKLVDKLKNTVMQSYYKDSPMKIQKFNGFRNTETGNNFTGTKLDGDALWFGLIYMYRNGGQKDYQHFLGQFSDKTSVYTGNAPKWEGKTNWSKASQFNSNLLKDAQYIEKLINQYRTELSFEETDVEGMKDLARDFAVSFSINSGNILPALHGTHADFINEKTGKFDFDEMIKRAQVVISPGYQIVTEVEGGLKSKLRYVIANEKLIKTLQGIDHKILDGLNFMSEDTAKRSAISMGSVFAREKKFGGVDMIKAVVTGVDENRILIKSNILNIGVLKDLYGENDIHTQIADYMFQHKIDFLSFPSSAKKYDKAKETVLFNKIDQNLNKIIPKIIEVNLSDFYIQQDLRHEVNVSPYDLPNQLYSNIVTLNSFKDMIVQISHLTNNSHDFVNKMFSGFKDITAIQQYLLMNTDVDKDGQDFYDMIANWSVNDPAFRAKLTSKLINLVNRDVLELNVPRQSSIEIPDTEGRLLGLRKDAMGHVLLPEIGVNIPGIRYAKDKFKTYDDAVQWMKDNDRKLLDLKNNDGSLQLWQVYQDPHTDNWVVPGQPILSTRVPAGDLHSHTVACARYKINSTSALTMINMQSQINSGSDNDGDARYNWVLTNDGEFIVNDDSYHGSVNKLLLNMVDEYQSVDNFDKISNPINTKAFDTIIEDIMKDYHNPDQIDENNENSILSQSLSRKKNMTGYNLKGIMSNLTSSFSYLKAFNVKDVVEDKYNVVKAALEDILNLAFDNVKDPKIEKLGINEATAQMFVYELITNKLVDKAKNREDAQRKIDWIIKKLAQKYSPYSSTKNSILSEYQNLSDIENRNLKREKKSTVLGQLRENHLEMDKTATKMVPTKEYNTFMKIYQGGQSLELIGRVRKIRDGLPNRLSDFMSLKNTMMEFVHGNDGKFQHFFFDDNLYGQNTNNPVFDPNYKAFSLARNIFSLNPGSDVINHLDELFTNNFDERNALTDSPRSKKRLKSNFELSSLASMADFEYLMKLRDQSYAKTESLLTNENTGIVPVYQRAKNLTPEERATKQSYIANDNRFLDLLDLDRSTFTDKGGNKKTTTKIKVNSYTGNTKLSPEDLLAIQQDFAKLPFNLRRALTYYTIVNYGTTSSLRGGGFFGLMDAQSRIDFTQLQYTTPDNAAMGMLLYKQMEAEIKRYADQVGGIVQTEDRLDEYGELEEVTLPEKALKNLRTILREEKLDLNSESALAAQHSFTGLLDMLNGTISTDARFESGLVPYMNRLGIKSREELIQALEKIQSSDLNMKYQFNVRDKGTSIVMQDPALFAFMFDHFKKTYSELSVFNNVQEFLDFIQKNTGRTMGFDLDAIGAAFANAVYISTTTAQQDTFFHEHAHIYWDAIGAQSKEKNRLRSLYGWNSSMDSQETEKIDEMVIQDIGVVGTGRAILRFEGNRLGLFLDYLRQFWNQVRSMFSLTQKSRKQAEMYFLQQIVADQVWSGGKYQSEIANNEMMHYQNGVTGDYWGTGILDIGHKGIDYSTVASFEMSQSDIFENKRLEAEQSIENIEKQIQQNEINFVQLDKIDANVFVSDNSRMYYRLEDGRVLRLDNEQKVLDRESLTDQIMQREERFSIRHAAIANMVQWAAEDKVLQPFKFDNEEIYLGDLFSDPIATFEQIRTIVQNTIHEQFGVSKIEVGKVVYDDQAKHLAQMDLVGRINPQGDMIMVKFLPTIHSLEVEPGRFSPEYTNTHGRFRPNTPLEKIPNNLEQKVKNSLSQFAYMYNEMAKQSGEQKQITRSVVVPLVLTEEGLHVTDVKEESSIEYNYTLQDKLLAQEVLQFAINDKMFNQAFNPVSEQELAEYKMQKRATAQEQDFADTQAKGPHIVAAFTARSGNVLSAWNVAVNSNLGHGSWLNTALNQLGWKSFMVTNKKGENKSSTKQRDFTLSKLIKGKLNDDGSPRGSVLYMSPGSGKTFAAENHIKLYDSDEILERSLLTGYYDYLTKDSVTGKALHMFSDSHPVLKTIRLFGKGSDGKTMMTFKSILDDYHTGKISLNLFAFQMSSLIHELRMIAARELKVNSSGSKEQMRSETSELSGSTVDMIRLNTPYEVLTERIDDANKAGYHVLTSTLMHPEFKYLIDLSFDSVNLLRDDVKQKKGFGLMQYRTMSHQRKNVIVASDQKWNETRYKLENEIFASDDNIHYTDRYATDVLFEQPFHSFKEKIAGLKSLYAIEKLGISYSSYRQKLDQSFNESIVNGDRDKAQENLSLTMEEFINQKWKERFPNYDENGRTTFTYAQLETLMKNNNLSGDPYSLLGFLHNGGISEEQVVDKFIDNISLADKLWEEIGTMESFADRFDYANAKTYEDKMFMNNSLIELTDRIRKLDLFNGDGLMHLVTSQNAINDLLATVELESKEGGVNRPNTTLLGKILTHPDFKWIPGVDYEKMMFLKQGLHKIFKPQGKVGRLFKLDRLIDKRHTLLQQLMIRQQVTHNTITEESNTTMQDLSSKFALFSALDKSLMTYKYGEKEEDKISSMHGRTAYINRDEALELRKLGQLSEPAFDYLEQLREQFDKYDFKYHKQRMKYGDDVPMFMPDVQAQLEPMSVAEFVSQDSEFARLVNTYYGLDINGPTNMKFRRELYNAMNVSGEDSFVVQATASMSTGQSPDGKTYDELKNFKQFNDMTFADVKRTLFDPIYINGFPNTKEAFENSIERLEKLRNMVSKTATAKYMKKERTLHQSGAFNKGMILRTEMFHEANLIYLNSLISNFHTKTLAPFAQFVEDRYKSDAAKSMTYDETGKPVYHDNYMQNYITSYIDERVFKHTPEDMVQFKKVHRIVGTIVSLAGLGLNLGGAVGNFTAGQMQNFMASPTAYGKGFARIGQLPKAIKIMHHSNVGMVVDDVTFKRSEKFMEGLMRTGMFFTTNVEDINQGILFLGSMTDEEISWYNNDGTPIDPDKKMSHFRTIQIENELRRIHGDYGHNRPLYGASPWLMEMGRFKMGWMQTLLNDYWGGTSVDIFNQEHRSVRQSVFNSYNRFIVHASTIGFSTEARLAKKMKMLENVLNSGGTDDIYARLKDSVEESVESVYDGMEHRSALEYRTFPLEIPDPNDPSKTVKKWITVTDNDGFTTRAKMVVELLMDHEQQKNFLNKDRVDSENYRRLHRMLGVSTLGTIGAAMAYMTLMGLMSGAGGDPEKKEMSWEDWGHAFAYGFKSEGILGSVKKVLSGQTVTSLKDDQMAHPLTSFSSFSPEVWRGIARMKMFMNFGKQINSDVLIPYNPVQLSKFVTPSAAATAGMAAYAGMLIYSAVQDIAPIFSLEAPVLHHFNTINLQAGYNTEMTKTPFYLRKVLPMKWMFQWMYNQQHVGENWNDGVVKGIEYSLFSYPSQQMFEDSQIFLRTMSQMNSLYDLAVGAGYITPEQIPELSKVVQQMVKAKYYNTLEWRKAQGMQPITEMKDKGKYQINRKQREKLWNALHGK